MEPDKLLMGIVARQNIADGASMFLKYKPINFLKQTNMPREKKPQRLTAEDIVLAFAQLSTKDQLSVKQSITEILEAKAEAAKAEFNLLNGADKY